MPDSIHFRKRALSALALCVLLLTLHCSTTPIPTTAARGATPSPEPDETASEEPLPPEPAVEVDCVGSGAELELSDESVLALVQGRGWHWFSPFPSRHATRDVARPIDVEGPLQSISSRCVVSASGGVGCLVYGGSGIEATEAGVRVVPYLQSHDAGQQPLQGAVAYQDGCWVDTNRSLRCVLGPLLLEGVESFDTSHGADFFHGGLPWRALCAVDEQGLVRCAREGLSRNTMQLFDLDGLGPAAQVAYRSNTVCARGRDGLVRCVGSEVGGPERQDDYSEAPVVTITEITDAIDIDGHDGLFCAALQVGAVRCWGRGVHGVISDSIPPSGEGRREAYLALTNGTSFAIGIDGAIQVSVGEEGICALRRDGVVVCQGRRRGNHARHELRLPDEIRARPHVSG